MRHQDQERAYAHPGLGERGVVGVVAAVTAGMVVVIVAGVSGIVAGAWLLSW